jgi:hypothetical protein
LWFFKCIIGSVVREIQNLQMLSNLSQQGSRTKNGLGCQLMLSAVQSKAGLLYSVLKHEKCQENIVTSLLKARIVKPAETAVAREQLCKHTYC